MLTNICATFIRLFLIKRNIYMYVIINKRVRLVWPPYSLFSLRILTTSAYLGTCHTMTRGTVRSNNTSATWTLCSLYNSTFSKLLSRSIDLFSLTSRRTFASAESESVATSTAPVDARLRFDHRKIKTRFDASRCGWKIGRKESVPRPIGVLRGRIAVSAPYAHIHPPPSAANRHEGSRRVVRITHVCDWSPCVGPLPGNGFSPTTVRNRIRDERERPADGSNAFTCCGATCTTHVCARARPFPCDVRPETNLTSAANCAVTTITISCAVFGNIVIPHDA